MRPEEDKAPKGLQAFVKARKGSELWAGLIADAEKRIAWCPKTRSWSPSIIRCLPHQVLLDLDSASEPPVLSQNSIAVSVHHSAKSGELSSDG